MRRSVEVSICKNHRVAFDELKALADISGARVSKIIGGLVVKYMNELKGKPQIVLPVETWDLSKFSKDELLELNTLIYQLNNKVAEELCRK